MCFHNGNGDNTCLWLILILILICCCCGNSAGNCQSNHSDGCSCC